MPYTFEHLCLHCLPTAAPVPPRPHGPQVPGSASPDLLPPPAAGSHPAFTAGVQITRLLCACRQDPCSGTTGSRLITDRHPGSRECGKASCDFKSPCRGQNTRCCGGEAGFPTARGEKSVSPLLRGQPCALPSRRVHRNPVHIDGEENMPAGGRAPPQTPGRRGENTNPSQLSKGWQTGACQRTFPHLYL